MNTAQNMINIISARDDFVNFNDNYNRWLLNPKWEIWLSISFSLEKIQFY